MKRLLGDEYIRFAEPFEDDRDRHMALRLNTVKCSDAERVFRAIEESSGEQMAEVMPESVPWEPKGFYYSGELSPGKHPYHEAGLYYIQEPSAMAPVHYLDPKPGERILDLCAAPGGKSTQIADCMKGEGILVSNEINRERAKILSLNIERMGITNAMVLSEDSSRLAEVFEGYFDRILVDAPCSGEGMFRKNEIATSEWSPENVVLCAERQREILDNAARMLLPGGRLVYSTCTFSPEENEQTIARFLALHRDFHTIDIELTGGIENGRPAWAQELLTVEGLDREVARSARLWPHKVRGEGHFLCVLVRDGSSDREALKSYIPGGRFIRAGRNAVKPLYVFLDETLEIRKMTQEGTDLEICLSGGEVLKGGLMSFGDQLFLAPSDAPSPNGLKVLRCGLHLGTLKKERFEPSHALALALSKESAKLSVDLPSASQEIRQYLNGQTLRLAKDAPACRELISAKGWCLITTDGYSIGWAKLAGGMLKNHYPKGLRINY